MQHIITAYIQEQLLGGRSETTLSETDDLLGAGLVDSMGMMKLIAFIEENFNLKIPPEDLIIENFMTVEAIGNYLARRKEKRG